MSNPENLRYTKEHEWVRVEGDTATVGITEHAANALGDVVFVQPPEVGNAVSAGEVCGEIESTKSVSDLYAPVSGEVTEVNTAAVGDPALLNTSPQDEGWLFRVRTETLPEDLLDAAAYAAFTEES